MLSFVVFAIFATVELKPWAARSTKPKIWKKLRQRHYLCRHRHIHWLLTGDFPLGVSTNWQQVLSNNTTNLGNITYVLMKSPG